ncbi:MAG: DUF3343 domain-containing protein [Clostridia bacterium]
MDILAAFSSRSEALRLYNALNERRIAAVVLDTPKRIGKGCGLSVAFNACFRHTAEEIIRLLRLKTLIGFYLR